MTTSDLNATSQCSAVPQWKYGNRLATEEIGLYGLRLPASIGGFSCRAEPQEGSVPYVPLYWCCYLCASETPATMKAHAPIQFWLGYVI